jgi:pimeloyl-ACP methyl ester carboxylesterase
MHDRARIAVVLFVVFVIGGCDPARGQGIDFEAVRPGSELAGEWIGGTDVLGGATLFELSVRKEGPAYQGSLRALDEGIAPLPILDARREGRAWRFAVESPLGRYEVEVEPRDGILVGAIAGPGSAGRIHLLPRVALTPEAQARHVGTYTARQGHTMLVTWGPGGTLAWIETEPRPDGGLRISGGGRLYAVSDSVLFSDRSIRSDPEEFEHVIFARGDGDTSASARWFPERRDAFVAHRRADPVRQEAVGFSNGDVALAGTIFLPPGEGPHPAIVMGHGSGPATRASILGLIRVVPIVASGYAVLVFDKRGAGDSSGDWTSATFDDLATDLVAAIGYLESRSDVDAGATGILGHSQGGWVGPLAAARSSDVEFVIVTSGGGIGPAEQEAYRAEAQSRAAGLPETDVTEARRVMELKWRYAAGETDWDRYRTAAEGLAGKPSYPIVAPPITADSPEWAAMRSKAAHRPAEILERLSVPVLVVLGTEDALVPAERAAAEWRAALASSEGSNVVVLEGLGHPLIRQESGATFLPAEFVTAVTTWLRDLRAAATP